MSQYERNMKYLNDKRIIYRRNPISDKPSAKFEWGNFYEQGTHECYALFQTKAKINTNTLTKLLCKGWLGSVFGVHLDSLKKKLAHLNCLPR